MHPSTIRVPEQKLSCRQGQGAPSPNSTRGGSRRCSKARKTDGQSSRRYWGPHRQHPSRKGTAETYHPLSVQGCVQGHFICMHLWGDNAANMHGGASSENPTAPSQLQGCIKITGLDNGDKAETGVLSQLFQGLPARGMCAV